MRRQRQNIGAATAAGNRGDGRRKGDIPVRKPTSGKVFLDLNKLVAASFEENESQEEQPGKYLLEGHVRQPIYIDNPPPSQTNIDPVILAQQIAMFQENSKLLNFNTTRSGSGSGLSGLGVSTCSSEWRCTWCMVQQIYTPTIRRGPLGGKSLCQACGIWFERGGVLPFERYQACRDGPHQ